MCTFQELKDSNKDEHNDINTKILLIQKDVKIIFKMLTSFRSLMGIGVTLLLLFSGIGANYQRLTYKHELRSAETLDKVQDSISIHWRTSKQTYNGIIKPHILSSELTYDSILLPTRDRSIRNESMSINNSRLLMKHGLK